MSKNWEKNFELLDNDEDFKEFLLEYGPTGMVYVDDDNLQTFIAKMLAKFQ